MWFFLAFLHFGMHWPIWSKVERCNAKNYNFSSCVLFTSAFINRRKVAAKLRETKDCAHVEKIRYSMSWARTKACQYIGIVQLLDVSWKRERVNEYQDTRLYFGLVLVIYFTNCLCWIRTICVCYSKLCTAWLPFFWNDY